MKRLWHAVELLAAALLTLPAAVLTRLGFRPPGVTIIGWWGSETVGDVAILGQLLDECTRVAKGRGLRIVSFAPAITRASLDELGRRDVKVVPVGLRSALTLLRSHAVIVGGGPLMESPSMRVWMWRLRLVRIVGAQVVLYGNGIGPVRSAAASKAIRGILDAATHIALRDRASLEWAAPQLRYREAVLCVDPAWSYARARRHAGSPRRQNVLALALRLPGKAYRAPDAEADADERFLATLAAVLNRLAQERELRFEGCVMHEGFADSDDRALYRRLRERLVHPDGLQVASGPHTVAHVIRTMETSAAALTVRFHGFVIAAATETPVVAVDYAAPLGKVSATAELLEQPQAVVRWDQVNEARLHEALRRALDSAPLPASAATLGESARAAMLESALR